MAKVRGDQPSLPDADDVKNPKVHRAALRYIRERDERMEKTEQEKEAHNALLDVMIQEGLESYKYGDLSVSIDLTRKCKVKRESAAGTASGEGDDN